VRENVSERFAPGWPGISPRWTSSAKSGVGTALNLHSRVWFTLSHGILNEVYYPRVDQACTRDQGLIVTDGSGYFSEEKRDARSEVSLLATGFVTVSTEQASAVVYCTYIGYPSGCVVRPGVVLRPRPVARAAAREAVRPGTPMNRGGPVNRVGRR